SFHRQQSDAHPATSGPSWNARSSIPIKRAGKVFADSVGLGFAQGKTMLFRRVVLESAGGIRALGLESAEDAAFTKLVRKSGLRVRVVNRPFPQPLGHPTAAEVWRAEVRWA